MGMFTTIIGEIEGFGKVDIQIYGGDDNLEVYHVGDTVRWSINANKVGSGHLTDGVYIGIFDVLNPGVKERMAAEGRRWTSGSEVEFYDAYVAIKDHVIVAIGAVPPFDDDTDNVERDAILDHAYALYAPIKEATKALYTREAWARHEIEVAHANAQATLRRADLDALSESERREALALVMIEPIKTGLEYASLGRRILNVDEK